MSNRLELPTERLVAERDGAIGWIVFNHPQRHNALGMEMQEALPEAVERFQADSDIRVVVLRGAGERAFASGADISEFEKRRSSTEARQSYEEVLRRAGASLASLDKPLVAMIHGFCMGGGLAFALQADVRIAADDARFGIPAARLGLGYRFAGVKTLVDLVGPAYASEILLTARRFDAEEALRMGLVNRVVAKTDLLDTVRDVAGRMAENAPLTLRAAKTAIREATKDREQRDLTRCERQVLDCFESEDYREGRRAFLEKRKPVFRGR